MVSPSASSAPVTSTDEPTYFGALLRGIGILLGLFARDLGRCIAVAGALTTGFTTLRWAIYEKYVFGGEWRMFLVAAITFVLTGWICSRD